MKQNDIAMVVLIVAVSLIVSWFVGGLLLSSPENREAEVEVVQPISAEFPVPSEEIFVEDFINPTELIKIGETSNKQPFNNSN